MWKNEKTDNRGEMMRKEERNFPVLGQLVSTGCGKHSHKCTCLKSMALQKIPDNFSSDHERGASESFPKPRTEKELL